MYRLLVSVTKQKHRMCHLRFSSSLRHPLFGGVAKQKDRKYRHTVFFLCGTMINDHMRFVPESQRTYGFFRWMLSPGVHLRLFGKLKNDISKEI